ncbi:MAG TPA: ABC transporter permease [Bryobacteraceae bacterium]|nr:ABC transporter permease [Bryobacteraceae bacterium]
MSAEYLKAEVKLDSGGSAGIRFELRNDSEETWRGADGMAVGYQLFDADTDTLIEEGPRFQLPDDVAPGASVSVLLPAQLPPENGRYEVRVSLMREGVCWYYDRGWPFLEIAAAARDGVRSLKRVRITTRARLRREHLLRAIGRAFVYPPRTLWRNRGLIRVMVRRDVLGRYRGSFGGSLWTVINPLLLMLTYYFVFGVVLQSRFPGDPSRAGFVLYFLAGMLPWLAFSEAVGRSPTVLVEHRNFVKKLVFAVETLPANLVVSGLVSEFFAVILFCGFLLVIRHSVPLTILWLPVLLVPQILFTAGVSWFLAALGAFVRDLGQFIGFLMTIWFFITPICYPEDSLPPEARAILFKNPIYVLVRGYRAIFLESHRPEFGPLWQLWVIALVVFVAGHAWFYKLRKSFADML